MHKGYLEMKISKRIFKDMCKDTESRIKLFKKNVISFFQKEFEKNFSFILSNEEDTKFLLSK